jgi:hypothetical protein
LSAVRHPAQAPRLTSRTSGRPAGGSMTLARAGLVDPRDVIDLEGARQRQRASLGSLILASMYVHARQHRRLAAEVTGVANRTPATAPPTSTSGTWALSGPGWSAAVTDPARQSGHAVRSDPRAAPPAVRGRAHYGRRADVHQGGHREAPETARRSWKRKQCRCAGAGSASKEESRALCSSAGRSESSASS